MSFFDAWVRLSDNSLFDYMATSSSGFLFAVAVFDLSLEKVGLLVAIMVGLTKIIPAVYNGYKFLEKRAKNRRANDDSSIE